jgi:hypothetical protein
MRNEPSLSRSLSKLTILILATGGLLPAQNVWFTPLPYTAHPVGTFGSTDYLNLFSPSSPWQQASSHVQVLKLYGVDNFSDTDLTNLLADLRRRNIALALEWPVLSSSTCGSGIEGFGGNILPALQRIQALGGTLSYLAMQQPFQWGSLYTGANSCRWTAQQVAANALLQINQAKTSWRFRRFRTLLPTGLPGTEPGSTPGAALREPRWLSFTWM